MKTNRILALILTLALLMSLAPSAFADKISKRSRALGEEKTYYVDSKLGSDDADGSYNAPLRTLREALSRDLQPGTSILLRCGRTYQAGVYSENAQITASGTESMPITLSSYGEGSNPVLTTAADENVFCIRASFIKLSGLDFTAPNGCGVLVHCAEGRDVDSVSFDNCRFYNIYNKYIIENNPLHCAILLGCDYTSRAYNCSFTNLEVFDCAYGIEIGGTTFECGNEYFISAEKSYSYNFLFDNIYCHDIRCGGLVLGALRDSAVRNSRFIRCARNVPFAVAAIWTHHCDNIMMEYCEIAGSTNLQDGMAIDFDGWSTNCTYRYIYSHDNSRFMKNCLYDRVTRNRGCMVDHCLSVNDNRFPSIAALPLASQETLKLNNYKIALVMDKFTFTNNILINCGPIYFGNLSNANISNNYFGGKSIITGLASVPTSVSSATMTGKVRNNTFYHYTPLLGIGNRVTLKGTSAATAYNKLFPNGVHTP